MHNYEKLRVWRDGVDLAKFVYLLTRDFPKTERFGMSSQMQRAAVSITSNIAEGAGRRTQADFRRFLDIAVGSANEVASLGVVANELGWLESTDRRELQERAGAIRRQLRALSGSTVSDQST